MTRQGFCGALACIGYFLVVCGSTDAAADNFGAIAFAKGNGAVGYSFDYRSRGEAEEQALQECGRGCAVVLWFKDACGALAVGEGRGYGTGWSARRGEAEAIAMRNCRSNTDGCTVVRWTCTTR
jgi:serine/threonine-protein kinase